jgi:hypothetical protein
MALAVIALVGVSPAAGGANQQQAQTRAAEPNFRIIGDEIACRARART